MLNQEKKHNKDKYFKYLLVAFVVVLISIFLGHRHFMLQNAEKGKVVLDLIDQDRRKVLLEKLKKYETLQLDDEERMELYCDVLEKKETIDKETYDHYKDTLSKQLNAIQNSKNKIETQHFGSPIGIKFKEDLFERGIPYTWIYSDGKENAYVFTKIKNSQYIENIWTMKSHGWCLINEEPGSKYPDNDCPFDARIELTCEVDKEGVFRACSCNETDGRRLYLTFTKEVQKIYKKP